MKLIQILVVAVSLAVSAVAQTGGQNSDGTTASTSKQQSSSAQNSTDSKKKSSAKPNASTKKTDSSTQTGPIKVIPLTAPASGKTTAPASASKNGPKATAPSPYQAPATTGKSTPSTSSGPSATQKTPLTTTTGKTTPASGTASSTGTTQSGKTASSSKQGNQPATGQSKQTAPVIPISPASKQTAGKQAAGGQTAGKQGAGQPASKQAATTQPATKQTATQAKGTNKNAPIVVKTPSQQPKLTIKKPSKEELAATSKVTAKMSSAGRRDPFVSPIRTVTPQAPIGPNCSTGKRCLAINELIVQGTAKDTDGRMMAIVASSTHRAYFLRENDQVFNGTVQKITSDSVIFRESIVDNLGRQTTHEVVKRINPSS